MKRSDAFPSRFLSSDEVGDKQYKLIIGHVEPEEMTDDDGKTKTVPVCYFQNTEKVMRLNATNWDTLEAAYGEDSDDWHGKTAIVYVDPRVKFGKKFVKGLRLRISSASNPPPPRPGGGKPIQEAEPPAVEHENPGEEMDDEIPF